MSLFYCSNTEFTIYAHHSGIPNPRLRRVFVRIPTLAERKLIHPLAGLEGFGSIQVAIKPTRTKSVWALLELVAGFEPATC